MIHIDDLPRLVTLSDVPWRTKRRGQTERFIGEPRDGHRFADMYRLTPLGHSTFHYDQFWYEGGDCKTATRSTIGLN